MDSLIKKLMLYPELCLVRSSNDAVINYDKICRTCMDMGNIKPIKDIMYEEISIGDLLEQHASIQVENDDGLPKHMCDNCIVELIKCYLFKKKCLQTQITLEEIIKYSETRGTVHQNTQDLIQVPCVFQELCSIKVNHDVQFSCNKQTDNKILVGETITFSNDSRLPGIKLEESSKNTHLHLTREVDLRGNNNIELPEVHIKNETVDFIGDDKIITGLSRNVEQISFVCQKACNVCKATFDSLQDLKQHRRDAKHVHTRRKITCYICGKLYGSLSGHMRTHTLEKPFECQVCSRLFGLSSNLKRHMKTHTGERPFICEVCGKGYTRASTLEDHKVIHSSTFDSSDNLKQHPTTNTDSSLTNNSDGHKVGQPRDIVFQCNYCGKCFNHVMKYRLHLRNHKIKSGEIKGALKEHKCNICSKIFFSAGTLNVHKLIHGEKKFSCNECERKFHTRGGLQNHSKVHTGVKPYSCIECGKSFSQIGSLKSHRRMHSGEKPYSCKICSKSFTQRTPLRYHLRMHSGEKPYKCNVCSKSFSIKGTLTVHIRTHTGETPYICDICDRGFYDSSSLKTHKKGHTAD